MVVLWGSGWDLTFLVNSFILVSYQLLKKNNQKSKVFNATSWNLILPSSGRPVRFQEVLEAFITFLLVTLPIFISCIFCQINHTWLFFCIGVILVNYLEKKYFKGMFKCGETSHLGETSHQSEILFILRLHKKNIPLEWDAFNLSSPVCLFW